MSHCPVCESQAFLLKKVVSEYGGHDICKCIGCRLEFVNPMPSKEVLDSFYASYSDVRAGEEVLRKNALRNLNFLAKLGLGKAEKVLDYGSGKNVFISEAGKGWSSYDPHTANNDSSVLKQGYYDGITSWGVLEHVTDPVAWVSQLNALLRQDGYLVLTTVDIDGSIPYRFKPPEHLTYWSRDAVSHLMARTGFRLVSYEPYFMVQHRKVYMDIMLRTMPAELKSAVNYQELPEYVEVPTNEAIIVSKKERHVRADE